MSPRLGRAIPVLRSFDEAKARAFYLDFLGFTVAFEHRFGPGMPLFLGIARGDLALRLSEHHGDGSPGANVAVETTGLDALHAELAAKPYPFARPGIVATPWGTRELTVADPSGNRLTFEERPEAP